MVRQGGAQGAHYGRRALRGYSGRQYGQADDLGGGVFKKRLNKNMYRSIILAKFGRYWLYQYLFAKRDRANIDNNELKAFRLLAKNLQGATDADISRLLAGGELTEICNGDQA